MGADWSRAADGPPERDEPEPDEPEPDEPEPDEPDGDEDQDEGPDPRPAAAGGGRAVSIAQDGAGWVLGLLLWGWVGLPFLKGGPEQVKKVLMAKFLNRAPDGTELP